MAPATVPPRPPVNGVTVWFTGLPSAGKTTIAGLVGRRLGEQGRRVEVLDEPPLTPELVLDTAAESPEESAARVLELLGAATEAGGAVAVEALGAAAVAGGAAAAQAPGAHTLLGSRQ